MSAKQRGTLKKRAVVKAKPGRRSVTAGKGRKRKQTEGAQFRDNKYFKTLIDNNTDAIACISAERNILYLNPAASQMLGYTEDELRRQIRIGIIHPNDTERVRKEIGEILSGVQAEIMTRCRIRHHDESWRSVEIHARNFLNNPRIRAIVVNGRDVTEQTLAEDALHESEARYRSLVELSPEAIAIHENGKFVYVNPAAAKLIGAKDPSELVGKPVLDVVHPDYREAVKSRVQLVSRDGSDTPALEEKFIRLDGGVVDVEVVAIPISFKGRQAVQVVVRDLTDRKKSEKTLQHRDAILEAVGYAAQQFLKSGSWQDSIQDVLKRLGTILEVNRVCIYERLQSPAGDPVVSGRYEWVSEGITPQIDSTVFWNLDAREHGLNRWFDVMQDGHFVHGLAKDMPARERAWLTGLGVVSVAAVPVVAGNKTWGFISFGDCSSQRTWSDAELYALEFAADILGAAIERQQYEYALMATEQKYRMLFEESRDGVYISTPEGKFVDMNLAGIQILGFKNKEEVLALDIEHDLYVDQNQRTIFQRAIEEQGYVKDFEQSVKRADGQKLAILETASVVRDSDGKIVMYRGIFRDVTKQRQMEQDLIQVRKMESLGTLAAGIAHDFNNILSIILVYNSLIQRIAGDPPKLEQSVGAIHDAVERGANLVKQILTFARKTEVHFGPIDINHAINDVARILQQTFPRTISVNLQLEEGIPFITADATQIQQVLLNLCINARDAMPGSGALSFKSEMTSGRAVRILFSEAPASEYVHISVQDTGIGMDEATRSHIFDPFFTTKDKGKGTGLGLSVVYGAVKNHDGFILVDSELSRGSTFNLYFPIPSKSLRTLDLVKGEDTEIPGGSETILIVEDEDAIRSNIESLFQSKGYRVIAARDGGEAVEFYRKKMDEIELVISDLGLPIVSGDQVLFLLKAINPAVKVILASGYFEPETKRALVNAGALDFVQKPYTPEHILRKVRKALDQK